MSIPKEPRQLMINLMYLVLTAMLALNVSAEIINAFFALDKGNQDTNKIVAAQTDATNKGMAKLLADPAKQKFQPLLPAAQAVRVKVAEFNGYIEKLREELIDQAGNKNGKIDMGDYVEHGHGALTADNFLKVGVPSGKKDKDVTTRILVDGPKGEELKKKIIATRDELLKIFNELLTKSGPAMDVTEAEIKNNIESMKANIALTVDEEEAKHNGQTWTQFKFRQMPLAAILPMMSKLQSDALTAEAALVNKMAELTGGKVIEFDAFFPVINAKKAYIIKGETFEAEVSVGTYSSQISPSDISLTVNGSRLSVGNDGKAKYSSTPGSTGKQTLNLSCSVRNPLTGKVADGKSTYEYEVGMRSVTVSADKMNVFYVGVDNPLSVSAAGVSSNSLKVSASGCNISGSGGKYTVTASTPTNDAKITVSGDGLNATPFSFRVKRIPDPVAKLGKESSGSMGTGEFKAQRGVLSVLENFDFDARCNIESFQVVRIAKRQDPVMASNSGATFTGARSMIDAATPGDTYYFDEVKVRCPGDPAARKINAMTWRIK